MRSVSENRGVRNGARSPRVHRARFAGLALALIAATNSELLARGKGGEGPEDEAGAARIVEPSLGRPVFVEPGGVFRVVAQDLPVNAVPRLGLVARGSGQRYALAARAAELTVGTERVFEVELPQHAVEQTYDLELRCGDAVTTARHCVGVARIGRRVRLVHLSNMNIGDIGAPGFDERLIEEVNLVSPTLIVATGDYIDATHPDRLRGWRELVDTLCRFDAPVLMACGDHDDLTLYGHYVAASPIGVVEVGPYRAVVVYDLPGRPLIDDAAQEQWLRRLLATPGRAALTFVVGHDGPPSFLRRLRAAGTLSAVLRGGRIGAWFIGGHRDTDPEAPGGLADAAAPMLLIRTHQSSTAMRDGASGVSRYRVVDLDGGRVFLPGQNGDDQDLPPSIEVGRIRAHAENRSDPRMPAIVTAASALPFRLDNLSVRVRLPRVGDGPPWCQAARLLRAKDCGDSWDVTIALDLPDKGAARAVVGTGDAPEVPTIVAEYDGPGRLRLRRTTTAGGSFYEADSRALRIGLKNVGPGTALISPIVRLDGETIPYRVADTDAPAVITCSLSLSAGESVGLEPDISLDRPAVGLRELQVYLRAGDVDAPICFPLQIVVER